MTCAPFDLKDYLFGELTAAEKESVERHLQACTACHEEVVALNVTRSTLLCLGEEEPVRRIAFVSDKVFEPRWWQRWLASGPQLGFASAAMLALAIVFHAVHAPASAPPVAVATTPVAKAGIDQSVIDAEIARRVAVAVEKASVEIEARQSDKVMQAVNARLTQSEHRYETQLSYVAEYLDRINKRSANVRRAAFDTTGAVIQ
jgi:anti-sigma factor RsiW